MLSTVYRSSKIEGRFGATHEMWVITKARRYGCNNLSATISPTVSAISSRRPVGERSSVDYFRERDPLQSVQFVQENTIKSQRANLEESYSNRIDWLVTGSRSVCTYKHDPKPIIQGSLRKFRIPLMRYNGSFVVAYVLFCTLNV